MSDVSVLVDGCFSSKVNYALEELYNTLGSQGFTVKVTEKAKICSVDILIGTPDNSPRIAKLETDGKIHLFEAGEALAIEQLEDTLVIAGRDDQGLMYALLEVSEQLNAERRSLREVREVSEEPGTTLRGIYTFLHNYDCEKEWFYSKNHWQEYFDLLAKSRFNSFHIVMAHQTNYLAPPFPFFVHVDEHPEIKVPNITAKKRKQNLEMLNYISELAQERGLDFVLGIWEVIAWKPETGHGNMVQESMVEGLNWDNLESYTYFALKELLDRCPTIKGIQLRPNAESGVPEEKQTTFFTNTVFKALEDCKQDKFLDLRGWGALPKTIEQAKEMDFPTRISMKYWAEHLGGPYQAPKQLPAYSYADFLRRPQEASIVYQVWTLGSHRIFIWGNPDYVKTFNKSLELGDSLGFEICPPLAQKGYGNESGSWRILKDKYEYYTWEFERYWMFYTLFGRLTYNSDASSSVWMRQIKFRFGEIANTLIDAYVAASKVLTFIIRFNMSDPNMYIWPEADTGGVLDFYLNVEPSDPALIKSFRESVEEHLENDFTARVDPREASAHLKDLGERCLDYVEEMRKNEESANYEKELFSTLADIESLAELALYHAKKILAAESLTFYYSTDDYLSLVESLQHLNDALLHWERLTETASEVYNADSLVTGPIDNVPWREKLQLVEDDSNRLREQLKLHRRYGAGHIKAFDFGGTRDIGGDYLRVSSLEDFYVERGFTGVDEDCIFNRERGYGWKTEGDLSSNKAPLVRLCDKHLDTIRRDTNQPTEWEDLSSYKNELHVDHINGTEPATFLTSIPAGHYEVILILGDVSETAISHGPLKIEVNGEELVKNLTIPAGEIIDLSSTFELDRGQLEVNYEAEGDGDWIATGLVIRPLAPVITHTPPQTISSDEDFSLKASVTGPEDLREVTCYLKTQDGRLSQMEMNAKDEEGIIYETIIPKTLLQEGFPIKYWFEATSITENKGRLPYLDGDRKVFELLPINANTVPSIHHDPVVSCHPGESLQIQTKVDSKIPLDKVRLHYRYTNQYYDYQVVTMEKLQVLEGSETESIFYAEIPGDYVVSQWDLMYYIEAVDEVGNGSFYPASDPLEVNDVPYKVVKVKS